MPLGMLGKYEKLDVLGHGASGIVYLAKDTLLNRQVALKVVNIQAGDIQHFLEEARVLDRLRHPNIVRVNNIDRVEGNIVLDMEYVRGKNLQEMLREQGPLPQDYALEIAAQTLDALQYAHAMQTVHRDIKPANILISRQGEVKLVDFGLAEILATNAYAGGAGTYAYMAPEDFAEEDRSDHQSDIWAVGVTLYEMLTGQRPFQVSKPKDPFAWKRILEAELPTPLIAYQPTASRELQAILNRALAREKSRRYPTAAAFRDDIRSLQAGKALDRRTLALDPDPGGQRTVPTSGTAAPMNAPRQRLSTQAPGSAVQSAPRVGTLAQTSAAQSASAGGSTRRSALALPATGAGNLLFAPAAADFGSIRPGELRSVRVTLRSPDAQGPVVGRVVHSPSWIDVQPMGFDRPKQVLSLTGRGPKTGNPREITDAVRVEVDGEVAEIPVTLQLLPARPPFIQVAAWFVPLLTGVLLPVAAVLYAGSAHAMSPVLASYVPAAAAATGLLAIMLLLVGFAADIGMAERGACGMVSVAMGAVLGVSSAHWKPGVLDASFTHTLLTGVPIGGMLFLQLLSLRNWRWWAFVVACTGIGVGSAFLYQLK